MHPGSFSFSRVSGMCIFPQIEFPSRSLGQAAAQVSRIHFIRCFVVSSCCPCSFTKDYPVVPGERSEEM